MNKTDVIQKINRAKEEISVAAGELDEVLDALRVAPGAEKVTISQVLEEAFEKLRQARASLVDLQTMLAKSD